MPPEKFDVVISVGRYNLPPGVLPDQAVSAIRRSVEALPGAFWIVVEHHQFGSGEGAVAVFPASGRESKRVQLQSLVEQAMAGAIGGLPGQPSPLRSEPSNPAPEEFEFPGIVTGSGLTGWSAGWSDSQAFTPFSLRGLAAESTPDGPNAAMEGLQGCPDTELLAQLLAYVGITGATELAHRTLARFGSFAAVLSTSEVELRKVAGLGTHGIAAIKLVHATALRLSQAAIMHKPLLGRSDLLMDYLSAVLARESIEHFRILFLDSEGRLQADEAQARGTVNHTPVYPREVVRRALELKAAAIILVHNHPSGDPSPSQDDIQMTATIAELGAVLKVRVQDHVIIGNGRWFSFRDAGLLDPDPD